MSSEVDVAAITAEIYKILKPLEPADRKKIVRAALTLLDDVPETLTEKADPPAGVASENGAEGYSPKVRIWMQKNGLDSEQIAQVFHIEEGAAQIIAGDVPGRNGKEKTINAYVLTGLGHFLTTGEAKFDDKAARDACKALGCLSDTNHATYMKDKGNVLGGSKSGGWTLTGPGLKTGADLLKEIASA